MPPTPGNRALLAAHTEQVLQAIGEALDIPAAQRPHYRDLLDGMAHAWLQQRVPEDQVATLLWAEQRQRDALARSGGPHASNEATSLASVALVPYLQDAGLCSGDLWGEQGLTCNYIDRAPGGPHISGSVRRNGETEATTLKEVPPDSALARILAAARNPTQAAPQLSLLDHAKRTATAWAGQFCDAIIPAAHAQTLPATGLDVQNCTTQITTKAMTQVVKLDPYALGLILFMETVGRIDDPGSPNNTLINSLVGTYIQNWFSETQRAVGESITKHGNRGADREARNACRHLGGASYNDCYGRVYSGNLTATVGGLYGLSLLTEVVQYYAIALVTNGDPTLADPALSWAVKSLLQATAQVDVYGEAYQLTTVQYAATDADQVFVLFPFGFSCSADSCGNVGECALLADDQISCMKHLAHLQNWPLRPQGGYIEHSLSSCLVQALPYHNRLPYRALRANELANGTTGLPQDVTFRSAYQDSYAPNHCDANQDGNADGFYAGGTQAMVAHLAREASEHTCPLPSSKQGPTDPTPPLGVTSSGVTSNLLGGLIASTRPAEQIPYWRWNLTKVTSSLSDYTAIYAGLASTKTAYTTAYGLPANNLVLPNCTATRTFNGVTSAPGQAFWAWHGAANELPVASPEMTAAAAAGAGLAFKDLKDKTPDAQARYADYIIAASAVAAAFNADQTYNCNVYPICTSVLCTGDSQGRTITASRDMYPMPEVNIILTDTLDHDAVGCNGDQDSGSAAQLYGFGGSVAEGGAGTSSPLPFTVERRGNLSATASVDYATQPGSGQAGEAAPGADYTPASGTVQFNAGEDRKTINVTVLGNASPEPDKKIYLRLSNASGAALPDNPVTVGTIVNDDGDLPQ